MTRKNVGCCADGAVSSGRDAKQRDDSETLGVVLHLPTATAALYENPDPGVQMPESDSQTP